MTTALQYFMVIVEEESIARAARRLFLSQQNLSNYVKRLEDEYGVLFTRKPQFQLTPVGKVLLSTLQQITVLEKNLDVQIDNMKYEGYGYLRIGIHATRARMLLPHIIPEYHKEFPNVFLDFTYSDVQTLEKMLQRGEIDVFFGVDVHQMSDFSYIHLHNEPIFFVASQELLLSKDVSPETSIISLNKLSAFPYLLSPLTSSFRKKIEAFCSSTGITLREIVCISDFELQLMLASQNQGACFCPQMLLGKMEELNRIAPDNNKLHALKVEDFSFTSHLSLVTHRLAFHSAALEAFLHVFQQEFSNNCGDDLK